MSVVWSKGLRFEYRHNNCDDCERMMVHAEGELLATGSRQVTASISRLTEDRKRVRHSASVFRLKTNNTKE